MAHDDINTLLKVIRPSVLYLDYTGRRAEALKLALSGKELVSRYGNKLISAWLCIKSGWILSQQGSHTEAIEQIEEGNKEYEQLADDTGICFAKCFLAQALRHAGELSEVEKLLEEVVTEASRLGYREGISIGEFERGKLAREQNDWNKAYTHFSAAYRALLELNEITTGIFSLTILAIKGTYGTAALKLGKYSEAKDASLQVLTVLEKWRYLGIASNFTARMHLQVTVIEEALENYSEAIRHAERALTLYISTKYEKGIRQAQQMLERLQTRRINDYRSC